jgi:hypothetical protein
LLEKPFQFRVEQVPPEYGGTNKISYGIAERIQTWTLEEEEIYLEDRDEDEDFPMEEGEEDGTLLEEKREFQETLRTEMPDAMSV